MGRDRIEDRASFDFLRYANCWEDADILCEALGVRPGARVLSIASAGDNTLALLAAPTSALAISGIESVLGSTATTDALQMLAGGTLATSNVESVLGSTGTADALTMLATGSVSVSALESVIGTSNAGDVVTLLATQPRQVGIILNKVDFARNKYYYSRYYGHQYKNYYAEAV